MDENKFPELKDILENIYRYNTTHKEGCFVFNFVGFKKSPNEKCVDCGEPIDEVDENKSIMGAHGNLETLRKLLNMLRDIVEDNVDDNGFVSV